VQKRRGEYGVDAPRVLLGLVLGSVAGWCIGAVGLSIGFVWLGVLGFANGAFLGLSALSFLWTTRRGKFAVWEELLDEAGLRGDEHILDVGCGRGAVLLMAAQRVARGRAVGIDVWSRVGQSGNSRELALRNAALEGVAERVELHTGDARRIPFPDQSFDLVTSSLVLHHVRAPDERARCVEEMARVLKPGGLALVADVQHAREYQQHFERVQRAPVVRRRLGFRFWYGGPHVATSLVMVRKDERAPAHAVG